jgi:hypothetical protein
MLKFDFFESVRRVYCYATVDTIHTLQQFSLGRPGRASVGASDDQPSSSRASTVYTSEEPSDDISRLCLASGTEDSSLVQGTTPQTSNHPFEIDPDSVIKQSSFLDTSGGPGPGHVYKCSLDRDASLEEVLIHPSSLYLY